MMRFGLALTLFLATAAPAANERPEGPWRQLIRYEAAPGRTSGVSHWIQEAPLLAPGAPTAKGVKQITEIWINHGAARVGGQAYRIERNSYDCTDGSYVRGPATAFDAAMQPLGSAEGSKETLPLYPHSAEKEVHRALCDNSAIALRGARAETVKDILAVEPDTTFAKPADRLETDFDADGKPDMVSIHTRPHSMRQDVEIVLGKEPNRTINLIAVAQPDKGPLIQSALRPAAPGLYVYACERVEDRDITPCKGGIAGTNRHAVEIVTPGQPSLLLWIPDTEPRIVRLPEEKTGG